MVRHTTKVGACPDQEILKFLYCTARLTKSEFQGMYRQYSTTRSRIRRWAEGSTEHLERNEH
jgi:hypothetical protein